jgi:anti-anti-sigma regulatory factor
MVIELSENIGVKNIKIFYSELMDLMKKDSEIVLDFGKVKRVDLSFVQVVMAANREYSKKGKQIKLRSVSNNIKKQLYMSGFSI